MISPNTTPIWLRHIFISMALVLFAASLRVWPLQELGVRLAYLTFYPAVMIASVYGGFLIGVLTTVLSALTLAYWSPIEELFFNDSIDLLGLIVFMANCVVISLVAEAMRRAQMRAKTAQKEAESANRSKSLFLSTISHELRTPLNAILGFSEMMQRDPGISKEINENLSIINRNGKNLLGLIDDVLDMAKIEAGHVALVINPFDLERMICEIMSMMSQRAHEKGLQLLLAYPPEIPRYIRGDAEKIRQMIINLMTNAIKFTNHGGVTLGLSFQADGENPKLDIKVKDTGIGISKADQVIMFNPFVQLGHMGAQKGTGLGLSIVREFAKLMGASIKVESSPDKGSLFWIRLPVQKAEAPEIIQTQKINGRVTGLEPSQPQFRILIVEDQEDNRLLLQRLLEEVGFTVQVASNGAMGVEVFQKFRPHFIWMDRFMPVMDGLETARHIRSLDGGMDVKIVAVTAAAFVYQIKETLASGMDDFVRKPYTSDEIFNCMEKHLKVRYIYAKTEQVDEGIAISSEAFVKLPESLRRDLTDALVLGNVKRIDRLMTQIKVQDAGLSHTMAVYLDNFNYQPILTALESAEKITINKTIL